MFRELKNKAKSISLPPNNFFLNSFNSCVLTSSGLKIFENEKVKQAIHNISKRHNISENVIKTIIAYEYENTFSKK